MIFYRRIQLCYKQCHIIQCMGKIVTKGGISVEFYNITIFNYDCIILNTKRRILEVAHFSTRGKLGNTSIKWSLICLALGFCCEIKKFFFFLYDVVLDHCSSICILSTYQSIFCTYLLQIYLVIWNFQFRFHKARL